MALSLQSLTPANMPLPIGYGQAVSQPFMVALMTDLVRPSKGDTIYGG